MTQCRSTKYEGFCEKRPADDGSLGLFFLFYQERIWQRPVTIYHSQS